MMSNHKLPSKWLFMMRWLVIIMGRSYSNISYNNDTKSNNIDLIVVMTLNEFVQYIQVIFQGLR